MKIDFLTEKDIDNITKRDECYRKIDMRLSIEEELITEDVFCNLPSKYDVKDMENSQLKLDYLKYIMRRTERTTEFFIINLLLISISLLGLFVGTEKDISIVILILSLIFIIFNIKNLYIRRLIKNNLKEHNINIRRF